MATAIAALDVGKHILVVGEPTRAEAFAELIGDEAADSGLCLGTLGLTGSTAALLPLSDVLVDRFRDDFWLILRQADLVSLERLVDYVALAQPSPSWRFIGASAIASNGALQGLSPAGKRRVAIVELD